MAIFPSKIGYLILQKVKSGKGKLDFRSFLSCQVMDFRRFFVAWWTLCYWPRIG